MSLNVKHIQILGKSAISEEFALKNRVSSVEDIPSSKKVLSELGIDPQRSPSGGGLLFEYYDIQDREKLIFLSLRPDNPEPNFKYIKPAKRENRLYVPKVISLEKLQSIENEIIFVEGEKKALSLAEKGYVAVSIGGVYTWGKKKQGESKELLSDFKTLNLDGRRVTIIFDSDATKDRAIYKSLVEFGRKLIDEGAEVYNALL